MNDSCRKEVVELHAFFQAWFRGELERDADHWSRFEQVLDPEFEFIGTRRPELVAR